MSKAKARFLQGAGLILVALVVALVMNLVTNVSPPILAEEPRVITGDWTLAQDETVPAGMYLNAGTVDLNGHVLTVEGNLIQAGGTLYVHGGRLNIAGDYRLQTESGGTYTGGSGILKMTASADHVLVGGKFVTQSSASHSGLLTAGVLEAKGDFTLLPGGAYNFAASGTHRVLLSGDGLQTVHLGVAQSYLNFLEIQKTAPEGLCFEGRLIAQNLAPASRPSNSTIPPLPAS